MTAGQIQAITTSLCICAEGDNKDHNETIDQIWLNFNRHRSKEESVKTNITTYAALF